MPSDAPDDLEYIPPADDPEKGPPWERDDFALAVAVEHRRRFGSVCDDFDAAARTYNDGADAVVYCESCRFVIVRTDGDGVIAGGGAR